MTKPKTAAAAVIPSPLQRLELVPVARLVESPSNHRKKTWGDMKDLVASIRAKGVLQPILARPVKGIGSNLLEIVFGHRRVRAAKEAGLEAVPAVVRELSDVEALEANIIENLQRADVHPMEEAEGMDELLKQKERPLTVDDLAAKVGKSKAYVYGRLKLLALCKEARQAFYDGKLSASVALLFARIPSQDLQRKALKDVGRIDHDGEPVSFRWASEMLQRNFMLKLADAPFKMDDAELLTKAGSCSACPKRTGSQPELFQDVGSADVCSDPICYREKVEASWKVRAAEAKAAGRPVLPEAEAKKVFQDYGGVSYGAPFVALDETCYEDPKQRSYKKLLGKAAGDQVVLAKDQSGKPRELVPKSALGKLLKAAGHAFKPRTSASPPSTRTKEDREAAKKAREKVAIDEAVADRSAALVGAGLDSKAPDRELWDIAIDVAIDQAYGDESGTLQRRFGEKWQKEWKTARPKMTAEQLRSVFLELFLSQVFGDWRGDQSEKRLRAWLGVDEKALRAEVVASLKAKAEAPAKGKKATGKPAARELPRGTAEELGAEDCLDCGVPANQPSPTGCEECDHGRTPPAKKAGPTPLVWTEVEDTHRADGIGGEYSILPGAGAAFTWKPSWVPRSGPSHLLGSVAKLTDAKAACERHHVERAGDALLANAGDGKLNAKGLKGAAVARKGGGR